MILRARSRAQRVIAAPLAFLGLAALLYIGFGTRASRSPEELWEHLRQDGFTVGVVPSHDADFYPMEDEYAEFTGVTYHASIDGVRVVLHEMTDVPRAMTFTKAGVEDAEALGQVFSQLPPKDYLHNLNYVLEITNASSPAADRIADSFARW